MIYAVSTLVEVIVEDDTPEAAQAQAQRIIEGALNGCHVHGFEHPLLSGQGQMASVTGHDWHPLP